MKKRLIFIASMMLITTPLSAWATEPPPGVGVALAGILILALIAGGIVGIFVTRQIFRKPDDSFWIWVKRVISFLVISVVSFLLLIAAGVGIIYMLDRLANG